VVVKKQNERTECVPSSRAQTAERDPTVDGQFDETGLFVS
jgi:hypothetical protein